MNKLKAAWQWIVGAVGFLIGLILLKQYFQRDLKADAKLADTKLQDAVIDEKLKSNAQAQQEANNAATNLIEREKKALKDLNGKSPSEIEDYYRNKK